MQYQTFSQDINHYQLDNGYSLERANPESTDFVHHWTAYRPNEEYHQDWTQGYSDLLGVPFCFWIVKDSQHIGGCLMLANIVAELFQIPPYDDYDAIFANLLPLLRHWSDDSKAISARYILPEQVASLEKEGFSITEQRHWMICPVMPYTVDFGDDYELARPVIDGANQYAEVFFAAFSGGVGDYGKRDTEQHLNSIQNYLENTPILEASSVIRDKKSGNIVTICLVSEYAGHASLNFVVTHPDYQGHGLSRRAIEYALNALYGKSPWMILAVTTDNPAMKLYEKMGFKAGVVISSMSL